MNRIAQRFQMLGETPAFIPYITAGDPTLALTAQLVLELERAGADVIELGVPFSDPVADGIVNQEAAQRALLHDVSLHDIVRLVKEIRQQSQIPIVLFTYFNPVLAYGLTEFAADCADAGVDGILCVDLPPEEAADYKCALSAKGVATVFLVAPTSPDGRIKTIVEQTSGFVYCVSRAGVTGARDNLSTTVQALVQRIKAHTDLPVAVGFGISRPEHAAEVAQYADGVVVGSAIVRLVGELGAVPEMPAKVAGFAKSLVDACKQRKAAAP